MPTHTPAAPDSAVSLASATVTASGTSPSIPNAPDPDRAFVDAALTVSAASGTTPSMTLTLQASDDGTTWSTVGSFPAQTAAAGPIELTFEVTGQQNLRWSWAVSGTTPSFTFKVDATSKTLAQG